MAHTHYVYMFPLTKNTIIPIFVFIIGFMMLAWWWSHQPGTDEVLDEAPIVQQEQE